MSSTPRYLQLEDLSLAYHTSSASELKVLLIHGNSGSGMTFRKQLQSSLGNSVGMAALDLPGHGESDPALSKKQYSLNGYAALVADVLASLKIENAILVGWSLGGHIAVQTTDLSDRVKGVLTFGSPPLGLPLEIEPAFLPHNAIGFLFKKDISVKEATLLARSFVASDYRGEIDSFITDIRQTNGLARPALGESISAGCYKDEKKIVSNLKIPLAVLHGRDEQLVNGVYYNDLAIPTLWKNEVQIIDGAGHAVHWEQAEKFNTVLKTFIADCLT